MQGMTTARAVVESLIAHGIDTVYAVPGVHNDPFFDALHGAQDRIRVIHARHEQTAAYMALGAALATGRPQVFSVVPGPGFLNASAALLTAWGMGAPVLALVGQIPSFAIDRGFGHLHEIPDQLGMMRHLTKFAGRITGPHDASALVAQALCAAMSGRTRPVALECAIDVWPRSGPAPLVTPLPIETPPIDPAAIDTAAAILNAAKAPLIIAGGGTYAAASALRAVAERLQAPVVSYRRGRGVLPTAHPLAVPSTVGHRLWSHADVVLGVGTRMYVQQSAWGLDDGVKIVRIDIDPEEVNRFRRPESSVIADAGPALGALLEKLTPRERPAFDLDAERVWLEERLSRLQPQVDFLAAMRAALPPDGILVDEITQVGFAARMAFALDRPRTYFSGYQDNLGYGFGTALGAKAACPDRAVLSIAGDGGFAYQAMELATAVRHKLGVVVVVFDDGAFGNVRRIQAQHYGNRLIACDLTNPDFVAFGKSFGVATYLVKTPAELETALRQAFARDVPALVHVPVGEMPSIWDMILLPRARGPALAQPALP